MESSSEGAADLSTAAAARDLFVRNLVLPRWFHPILGAAVALQIAATAIGVAQQSLAGLILAVAGCAVLAAVATALVRDFRRRNGVRLDALTSRVILGNTDLAGSAYALAAAGAIWAQLAGHAWLVAVAAVLGGIGYAVAGRRWWRQYRVAHQPPSLGDSRMVLAALVVVAIGGLVALMLGR